MKSQVVSRWRIAALAALLAVVGAAFGAAKNSAKPAPIYVCSKCHMNFSAAQAKADHYRDPMDGGMLVVAKPVNHATKTRQR